VQRIKAVTGIDSNIISGDLEAEYIYMGVKSAMDIDKEKSLIIDIGGGSIEFILGNNERIFWKRSLASTSQPPVCAMVSIISTPGRIGWPGKWPSKIGEWSGTWHEVSMRRPSRSSSVIRSTIWKYSSCISSPSL